jgi:serine/threonine-protein kinase ULK/ATG1
MAVMSKIKHPNILHLYEYLETTNNYYLVIDYCNNGDLENHVKKNQCLGEQESVYFLMQIMNGFKELHKHKIMHRDFKLANIFLNDDAIIIGDFGFAKSGSDMATTKLGSPITMAPELLNGGSDVRYTNKADLWSVGVCFYQMIFGKPPWNAMNIADLQHKVKTRSGDQLYIPNHPPTSEPCKELLKALLTVNPVKRIEWYQFFNHKLFEIHQ